MSVTENLNPEQIKGVMTTEGPVLILAGAGSGKTRVLTHRVAHLIEDMGVSPYHIMAITFTNKAAGEMRERVNNMVSYGAESVWVATFHSSCVRILRRFADRIGYDTHFSIYDADDQKTLMKAVCKDLNIDTKIHKERTFINAISSAKDELLDAEGYLAAAAGDFNKERTGQVYREYQARLRKNNAFDFDDLIMKTVELLRQDKEVLSYYQEKFEYVMVDEYQDTNTAQFELVRLLSSGKNNLCVVGDDDQSIYKFRGANIYNILNFEKHYPDATVIKLEQNYRSTGSILDAANGVIANNRNRKEKALWTEQEAGEKIVFEHFDSAYEEADYVASNIGRLKKQSVFEYKDDAILYRTNAQSRLMEEKLIAANIPYKIFGGVNFYSRREIKDVLAYLKTVDNSADDLSVQRIINVPKRGIGQTTINKVSEYARINGLSFFEAVSRGKEIPGMGKTGEKLNAFSLFIDRLRVLSEESTVPELIRDITENTGYIAELEAEGTDEAEDRIMNIDELLNKAVTYQTDSEEPSLSGFLEEVSLVADIDNLDETHDYVALMTLHSAKGLEFPNVYMVGMEDGLFPSYMSIDDEAEMEEERRLCYVGITRAKAHLTMTAARTRMIRGETQYNAISRFVKEIPENLISGSTYDPNSRNPADLKGRGESVKSLSPVFRKPLPVKNFGTKIEKKALDYSEGDRVRHQKFGTGTVTLINDGGKDYEVTVDFDSAGTKKMFASFARLEKV
ncbi:MAG: DNA helicase PcrA [Lachnospiraceae bacterium]|nr:DNA helicase PcrA [Lachnospiraceae bacterium]